MIFIMRIFETFKLDSFDLNLITMQLNINLC